MSFRIWTIARSLSYSKADLGIANQLAALCKSRNAL